MPVHLGLMLAAFSQHAIDDVQQPGRESTARWWTAGA